MENKFAILLKGPLFAGLSESELNGILGSVPFKEKKFRKDEVLVNQTEYCNRLIVLLSGSVRSLMTGESGKIMKVEDLRAPSPLAPLFLFGDLNKFPVEVRANEPVSVIIFSKETILSLFQQNKVILLNYLNLNAMYARRLSDKLFFLSFKTIRQKITHYLLKLPGENGVVILDRSQSSLAEYFGVTRPSLSRELANMQEEGLIEIDRKSVRILNLGNF